MVSSWMSKIIIKWLVLAIHHEMLLLWQGTSKTDGRHLYNIIMSFDKYWFILWSLMAQDFKSFCQDTDYFVTSKHMKNTYSWAFVVYWKDNWESIITRKSVSVFLKYKVRQITYISVFMGNQVQCSSLRFWLCFLHDQLGFILV